jgi:hypothetical protein
MRNIQNIYLNTSSTGGNVTGDVYGFPVLVRLTSKTFDFNQSKSGGADIRFTASNGKSLSYEIENWDAGNKQAEVWVRVDTVWGNDSSQYITKRVYDSLIADLKLPSNTPLLAGEVLYASAGGHNTTINTISKVIPDAYTISAEGLTGKDQFHFVAASQRTFGARYAQKMLSIESTGIRSADQKSELPTHLVIKHNSVATITLSGNFKYHISDLHGALVEHGHGKNELVVGQNLIPGMYLLSVSNYIKTFSGKIFKE